MARSFRAGQAVVVIGRPTLTQARSATSCQPSTGFLTKSLRPTEPTPNPGMRLADYGTQDVINSEQQVAPSG